MLLLTSLIWGMAFVVQRSGMSYLGPYTFQSVRTLLASVVLLPMALASKKRRGSAWRMPHLGFALSCGLLVGCACLAQQIGLKTTPAGRAGFISSLYVVLVPVLGIFLGRKVGIKVWIGVVLAVIGLYLLSSVGRFSVSIGDMLMLVCAALSAVHIVIIDRYGAGCDTLMLSCLQFFVAGLIPLPMAVIVEKPTFEEIWQVRWLIIYAGVMSSAVGYTLQILGQRHVPPAMASLILSLESVFAAALGAVLLHETMTVRELIGCALMLCAVVLAQLPGNENSESSTETQ